MQMKQMQQTAREQWFQSRIGKRLFEISTLHCMIDSAQKGLLIQDEVHAHYPPEYEQLNKSLFLIRKKKRRNIWEDRMYITSEGKQQWKAA